MPHKSNEGYATKMAPSQEQALSEFGGGVDYKPLNREARGEFASQGPAGKNMDAKCAVESGPGQSEALDAIAGSISGGGKSSSLDKGEVGADILGIADGSTYQFNKDSPWY